MSARQCPNCFAFVPPGPIVAYSYDLICPTCQSPLEISALSQNLSAFIGLSAGGIDWWLANAHYSEHAGALGGGLRALFGHRAFSVVAALVLILPADLKLNPLDSIVFQYHPSPSHPSHPSH